MFVVGFVLPIVVPGIPLGGDKNDKNTNKQQSNENLVALPAQRSTANTNRI